MVTTKVDVLIIGAGVVGCSLARQCAGSFPAKKIAVVEKNQRAGLETSSHNSGMIHTGIHENPKLLKSKLCVRGSTLATQFIEDHAIKAKRNGMMIVVPANQPKINLPGQLFALGSLMLRGLRLKIPFRPFISAKNYEPDIKVVAGIFLPSAYIVDPLEFTNKLQESAEKKGVEFYFNNNVKDIKKLDGRYHVTTDDHVFIADHVVNAAGLYADEIAALAGFKDYRIYPWRGEYYEVVGSEMRVSRPVSSVMPRHHGKGLQILPSIDGKLYIGPNSYPVASKDDYETRQTDPALFQYVASKVLTDTRQDNLVWAFAGMRPKLSESYAETDFIISKDNVEPAFINLIGIESPGLTAAMAIAEYVADLLKSDT